MDIINAILAINPDAKVSVNAEDYDQIIWHGDTAVISKEDIQAKQAELKADYEAKEYQRKRKLEYPPLEECIHALLDEQHLIELQAKRKLVKETYPK